MKTPQAGAVRCVRCTHLSALNSKAPQRPAVQNAQFAAHRNCHSCPNRKYVLTIGLTTLAGLLVACKPANASPMVLLYRNAAVLSDLRQLSKREKLFGSEQPTAALSSRLTAAVQQLQRIELLTKINQYDNARMLLRSGSFKTLRMDLGYGQEMYKVIQPEAVRAVVDGIEQLDGQLKRREPLATIKPQLQQLQEQLTGLAHLMVELLQ
eukprot:GHRR01015017.1.p1 GENE.GHRR01015017.1~~GHRR01015017.1.p1  ORF type:complete len:209 (+),score=62.14 GHRR01015017.1:150-776(+)